MNKAVLVLAFLGAVLVGLVAQMYAPDTPTGRTIAFVSFSAAALAAQRPNPSMFPDSI